MDFSIEELQFLNYHLDFITANKIRKWIKYTMVIHKNLSDVEAKEAVSNAIKRDEITFDSNKGSLLPYLKHSITMSLISKSSRLRNMPKHSIVNSIDNKLTSKWVDLSYFSDEEVKLLHNALTKNQLNCDKIKEIVHGYSRQFNQCE